MKRKILLAIPLLLIAAYWYLSLDFQRVHSTLYLNGDIVTMEEDQPRAEAVFVKDGIIQAIGTNEALLHYQSAAEVVIDLKGQTMLPGFIDPHTHTALDAFFIDMIDLSGFQHKTNASIWNYLSDQVKYSEKGSWLICKGLDPVLVPDLITPTKTFLDSIAPENPVFIISQSMHSFWANSLAFAEVGIDKHTPDPSESSFYEKDEFGELTGFLAEQEALIPFRKKITEMQGSDVIGNTVASIQNYAANGNTTVVTMGLSSDLEQVRDFFQFISTDHPDIFSNALSRIGILPKRKPMPRHYMYIRHDYTHLLPDTVANGNDYFKILGVKFWYDGAPYTGSMYMEDPYLESEFNYKKLHIGHNHRGQSLMSIYKMAGEIVKYESKGWQIAVHSQGDQSTREVMDAFDRASDLTKDNRHRIEHCLMTQPESLLEMQRMGIHPSFHINHLYYYGQALKDNIIGSDRAEEILPIAIADSLELIYTMHADTPMFPSEPLSLIQTAVTRETKEGNTIGDNLSIPIKNALEAMTINSAWQIKMEDKLGSIKVGKYADLVILDKNPLKVNPNQLRDIEVMRTVVAGQEVYVRD